MTDIDPVDTIVVTLTFNRSQVDSLNVNSFAVHSSTYSTVFNNTCMATNGNSDVAMADATHDVLVLAFGQ